MTAKLRMSVTGLIAQSPLDVVAGTTTRSFWQYVLGLAHLGRDVRLLSQGGFLQVAAA